MALAHRRSGGGEAIATILKWPVLWLFAPALPFADLMLVLCCGMEYL